MLKIAWLESPEKPSTFFSIRDDCISYTSTAVAAVMMMMMMMTAFFVSRLMPVNYLLRLNEGKSHQYFLTFISVHFSNIFHHLYSFGIVRFLPHRKLCQLSPQSLYELAIVCLELDFYKCKSLLRRRNFSLNSEFNFSETSYRPKLKSLVKVDDRSRGRPEGSLFNSYNTEV